MQYYRLPIGVIELIHSKIIIEKINVSHSVVFWPLDRLSVPILGLNK